MKEISNENESQKAGAEVKYFDALPVSHVARLLLFIK